MFKYPCGFPLYLTLYGYWGQNPPLNPPLSIIIKEDPMTMLLSEHCDKPMVFSQEYFFLTLDTS